MGITRKCRLWWPTYLTPNPNNSPSFLFGWFISSSNVSFDLIVAFDSPIHSNSDLLQGLLEGINKNMHASLQDKCKLSLLGCCHPDSGHNDHLGSDKHDFSGDRQDSVLCSIDSGSLSCGCSKLNGNFEQGTLAAPESIWINFVYIQAKPTGRRIRVIPKLDHIHWNGELMFKLDLHVILYEVPTFAGQYFSLGVQVNPDLGTSYKAPRWFDNLHQEQSLLDLDSIMCAINSANAAQVLFGGDPHPELGLLHSIFCKLSTLTWNLFAVSVALLSTFIYMIIQSSYALSGSVSRHCLTVLLYNVFTKTCRNIHVRCCQLLYWPLFVEDHDIRYLPCVVIKEKAALQKHSMWSSVVVDILLGNMFGITLWCMIEPFCSWVSNLALDITNHLLRTGCVWLMGNPAGFKLNTELAGVLGMICLTAIQIWSTLWAYTGFLLIYFTKGLSLCGIIFGLTTASALVIDTISLVTMHILTLHLFLSRLYSIQIQAVTALWRLFRGKKWNPLRNRLDSYNCSVEQHVVGSLLLTPIFLLLPTTSAFYIFFTIMQTAVCIICMAVEVAISVIHATPYAKIFLWLKSRKRFPSGIWFEITSFPHIENEAANINISCSGKLQHTASANIIEDTLLVSFLRSNYFNLGDLVWPHYRCIFSAFSWSSIASSAYGLLSGKSIPYSLDIDFPQKLLWIEMPWKEYWRLCYSAVSCKEGLPPDVRSLKQFY